MILGDLEASSYFNFSLWRQEKKLLEVEVYRLLACVHAKLLQLCPTVCDSMDSSSPGSLSMGILQVRILEWVATPVGRLPPTLPMDPACVS